MKQGIISISIIMSLLHISCQKQTLPDIDSGPQHTGYVTIRGVPGYAQSIQFFFSVPSGYSPKKSWPMIIALHNSGSNANEMHVAWRLTADSVHCVLLTIQGDITYDSGYGWGRNAEIALMDCIKSMHSLVNISMHKIFLIGEGTGGFTALEIGLKYPKKFAGLGVLNGVYDFHAFGKLADQNHPCRIYIEYLKHDDIVLDALHAAHILEQNGHQVRLKQIDNDTKSTSMRDVMLSYLGILSQENR
ncbi:hypothetical protein JW960_20285 [candidate division KSB1 bacterium]|nr:hypothetical protein [candidate division KSB1 bacterium]